MSPLAGEPKRMETGFENSKLIQKRERLHSLETLTE